jgi:hypothetical protein
MPPDTAERRPRAESGAHDDGDDVRTRVTGELAAWGAAVQHLHAAGLPAAVPAFPAAWLRRRGVRPDWVAAA